MKVGDIIINPYVKPEYNGKPNPNYKQIVIHIGPTYTQCLNYNGEIGKYYTHDAKGFEIAGHIDFKKLILGE